MRSTNDYVMSILSNFECFDKQIPKLYDQRNSG